MSIWILEEYDGCSSYIISIHRTQLGAETARQHLTEDPTGMSFCTYRVYERAVSE